MAKKLTTEGSLTEHDLQMLEEGIADILKKLPKNLLAKVQTNNQKNTKDSKKSCVGYNTTWSYGKCCGGRRHGQSRCANGQT